jgi:hypothetical protein
MLRRLADHRVTAGDTAGAVGLIEQASFLEERLNGLIEAAARDVESPHGPADSDTYAR